MLPEIGAHLGFGAMSAVFSIFADGSALAAIGTLVPVVRAARLPVVTALQVR